MCVVSLTIYSFIDTTGGGVKDHREDSAESPLLPNASDTAAAAISVRSAQSLPDPDDEIWVDKLSHRSRTAVGVLLSVWSGFLYGLNFDPPTWVKAHVEGASQDLIDYVFSHFCGIMITSIVYFVVYLIW